MVFLYLNLCIYSSIQPFLKPYHVPGNILEMGTECWVRHISSRCSCLLEKITQKQIPNLVFIQRSHFPVSIVLSKQLPAGIVCNWTPRHFFVFWWGRVIWWPKAFEREQTWCAEHSGSCWKIRTPMKDWAPMEKEHSAPSPSANYDYLPPLDFSFVK